MHQLFTTRDGSHSVTRVDWNVTFHSTHGALTESQHVYISSGFDHISPFREKITILEMGFGTGLNCLLTFISAHAQNKVVEYHCFEKYPIDTSITSALNYCSVLQRQDLVPVFEAMHSSEWNAPVEMSDGFVLHKYAADILDSELGSAFDLIYWDAFDPLTQPELWSYDLFSRLRSHVAVGGILVTYSSKVTVRRTLEAAGFDVRKIAGPAGKREITRATAI